MTTPEALAALRDRLRTVLEEVDGVYTALDELLNPEPPLPETGWEGEPDLPFQESGLS